MEKYNSLSDIFVIVYLKDELATKMSLEELAHENLKLQRIFDDDRYLIKFDENFTYMSKDEYDMVLSYKKILRANFPPLIMN